MSTDEQRLNTVHADWLPESFEKIVGIVSHQDFVLVATERCVYRMHYNWLESNLVVDRAKVTNEH